MAPLPSTPPQVAALRRRRGVRTGRRCGVAQSSLAWLQHGASLFGGVAPKQTNSRRGSPRLVVPRALVERLARFVGDGTRFAARPSLAVHCTLRSRGGFTKQGSKRRIPLGDGFGRDSAQRI